MEELVLNSKKGDIVSFTKLIQIVQNDLYRIAKVRLSNDEDVNDVIQETMIIAYSSIKKLKNPKYFKTWIIKILINECNKIYRNNRKQLTLLEKINVSKEIRVDIDDEILKQDTKLKLEEILQLLNYNERICIVLFYNSNYSLKEISDILNTSSNTIKSRITRAKQKIKKYYEGGVENEISKR